MKKIINTLLMIAAVIGFNLSPVLVHAAGGSITVSANKSTVPSGGSLIVAIYMNGGGSAVNAVDAILNYPASKLQYVGFSASGSAFEIAATNGGSDGSAELARGTTSSVSGSGLVGTVTFKALATSGSAVIAVSSSSSLVSDGNAVPYSAGSVSVNFGAVAATATGSTGTTAPATVTPVTPKDTTPPVITAIKTKDVTPFAATITWTTDEASDSVVEYGLDTSYGLSASASTPVTAHAVPLASSFLTPLSLLHYHVKSTDAAGNVQTSPDQTLSLPGVPVTVIVRGASGKPQAGVEVTLDSSTSTTDTKGRVTLTSGLGNKQITTSYQGVTIRQPVTVKKTLKPMPPIQLDLVKQPINHWMVTSVGLLVLVLMLIGIDAFIFGSRIFAKLVGLRFRHPITVTAGSFALSSAIKSDQPVRSQPSANTPTDPLDASVSRSDQQMSTAVDLDVPPSIPRTAPNDRAPSPTAQPAVLPQMTPLVLPKRSPVVIDSIVSPATPAPSSAPTPTVSHVSVTPIKQHDIVHAQKKRVKSSTHKKTA